MFAKNNTYQYRNLIQGVTMRPVALGEKGEIVVRTDNGTRSFTSADVNHLRAFD